VFVYLEEGVEVEVEVEVQELVLVARQPLMLEKGDNYCQ
jgi:hypothetical protein